RAVITRSGFDRPARKARTIVVNLKSQLRAAPHRHQPQLVGLTDHVNPFEGKFHPAKPLLRAQILVGEAERQYMFCAGGLVPRKALLPIAGLIYIGHAATE